MLVDHLYYLCYFGEEEEEDLSLLPCVLSSRLCVLVCLQELNLSLPFSLYKVSELSVVEEL